jgi:hypothetical protein
MSREAAQALDEMVWAVKPANDTLANLAEYICRYATEYLEETELRLRLDLPLDIPSRPLAAEVRHDVYLTLKEALNDVVKHAAAQEVTLGLSPGDDGFEVLITDDGQGFDPAAGEGAGMVCPTCGGAWSSGAGPARFRRPRDRARGCGSGSPGNLQPENPAVNPFWPLRPDPRPRKHFNES